MLTRLYIDNFRCFEKFEWKPGRKQLILGRNGTGKSSLMDALRFVCQVAVFGDRLEDWFKQHERARWVDQRQQIFEIEARLKSGVFVYRLLIEPSDEPARSVVRSETVDLDNHRIFAFENGEVFPRGSGSGVGYKWDQTRTALSTISSQSAGQDLLEFRGWLSRVRCWHINPVQMEALTGEEHVFTRADMRDMAAWYKHLVRIHPKTSNEALQDDLRRSLDGFSRLYFEPVGENVDVLYAEFLRESGRIRISLAELSDGQRYLICLYAIIHFVVAKGGTVIIDEPDNFISLREIQPWLMRIEEIADDNKGQVILISHHPEILNQWANPYGVQFVRHGAGPVLVEKFKGDPEGSLTAAEVVAEGWDFD